MTIYQINNPALIAYFSIGLIYSMSVYFIHLNKEKYTMLFKLFFFLSNVTYWPLAIADIIIIGAREK